MASKEPEPMRWPSSQLSSTKRMMRSLIGQVWSTKFGLAHGEITSIGIRGP